MIICTIATTTTSSTKNRQSISSLRTNKDRNNNKVSTPTLLYVSAFIIPSSSLSSKRSIHGRSSASSIETTAASVSLLSLLLLSKTKKRLLLSAKPQRLQENSDGVLYVNDKCINCAACSGFAPETFQRSGYYHHVVHQQPRTVEQIDNARAALAACPVSAIRIETIGERKHRRMNTPSSSSSTTTTTSEIEEKKKKQIVMDVENNWNEQDEMLVNQMSINPKNKDNNHNNNNYRLQKPFPRPFLNDVSTDAYWLGHHNEASFGAVPYLVKGKQNGRTIWIMIDTPKYSKSAIRTVLEVTDHQVPNYLFLSHVDDTADHNLWVQEFQPHIQRIFHSGDLGRYNWLQDQTLETVEILLPNNNNNNNNNNPPISIENKKEVPMLTAYSLDGHILEDDDWKESDPNIDNIVIFHTPGHSPGSITLYKRSSSDDGGVGILFTGDTYACTVSRDDNKTKRMTGFPRYGNNLSQQATTIKELLVNVVGIDQWDVIAPGHGHPRDYRAMNNPNIAKLKEMKEAIDELQSY